ncbi:hypothetical protein LPJ77_004795 [Coemansia sp. RSA 2523]|nr:hypothetical protein LPJ69_004155 [Coemansia sp. RSA 1752]KAJ1761048.1 hypothetical protein LPJ58_001397 [Coemansia sp. RSA 1591]KAJ1773326.1 hypothetical protein LPJ54_004532 [Coemansia sp. RSA 1824]KAJ1783006.1 hypothetical protein LPJ62_005225 [Coemansia sp. RSA 2167]KAJ1793021.1 hypothetical protein LPJ67_001383 [Coemansia sp. RSA 1938]KAJ1804384.1 hypothetical protein LPJ77_004795 [Coemansia sp. RSA 2523]KAJ2132593.1 hypothetical protein GGF48_000815 [Coemansia sp. RSA 921]KAJ2145610
MTYNIFDVVLHPSLFQQHAGEAPYQEYSYPPSVPVSVSSSSYIQSSNVKSDTKPAPWNNDDWAEIRRRLWNAKHHTDSQ